MLTKKKEAQEAAFWQVTFHSSEMLNLLQKSAVPPKVNNHFETNDCYLFITKQNRAWLL